MRRSHRLDADTVVIVVVMAVVAVVAVVAGGVLLSPGLPAEVARLLGISWTAAFVAMIVGPVLVGIIVRIAIARRRGDRPSDHYLGDGLGFRPEGP